MKKNVILTIALLLIMLVLLAFPNLCITSAQSGLLLWFNKVLPSLLPFMILINILVPLDGFSRLTTLSTPITQKLWHLPGYSFLAFFMGLIAGYPMGAKVIRQLYADNKLSLKEAERTLCFCNNCGPLFIIGTIGTAMLASTSLGYFLFFIHLISAFIMSLLMTRSPLEKDYMQSTDQVSKATPSFASLLNQSVMNAMDTIVCVGGYIILFSVLTTVLTETPIATTLLSPLSRLLPNDHVLSTGIASILELSNGSYRLSQLTLSPYTLALLAATIGFGGLCVYFQTLYVLEGTPLSTKLYLTSKLLQGGLSFALTLLLYPFFVLYTQGTSILSFSTPLWIGSLMILLIILMTSYVSHRPSSPLSLIPPTK